MQGTTFSTAGLDRRVHQRRRLDDLGQQFPGTKPDDRDDAARDDMLTLAQVLRAANNYTSFVQ